MRTSQIPLLRAGLGGTFILLTVAAGARINFAQDPVGDTYSVTISGTGFGASPSENDSVSAGDGIIATIDPSSTNTSIKAYFLIQTSAPGGNHSVTVSAGGQSSNGVNFFVQIPTSVADYS